MTRPVVAFQIRGRDAARLAEFYREIFGWEMDSSNPLGVVQIAPGIGGPEVGVGGFIVPGEPNVAIFVQVLSLVDTLAKAVELGGKRIMEPFDVPGGPTIAQMADPEGNIIGLVRQ
jgi:predicted enzyme related to lactoylglutathione lyase